MKGLILIFVLLSGISSAIAQEKLWLDKNYQWTDDSIQAVRYALVSKINKKCIKVEETAYQEKQSEQSKMEDQLMEMVGGSESNVWKLYESIMCVYFDMEEIIKQAVYLQGAYDRERMLK